MFLSVQNEERPSSKKRKKKKRKFSIIKLLLLFVLTTVFVGFFAVGAYTLYVIKSAESIDPTKISDLLDDTSFIYDSTGKILEKVAGKENRTVVPLEQIPKHLQEAVIAIEDERFKSHNGVDVKRVFGALWHDLVTMSLEQGASTITMQLAKNLYTSADKSLDRKILDAYYALQIEKILSKDQILYYYLNKINLSRGNYGVQAAANHFFSKDASQLDLAESAIIAGITKNPSRYSVYTTSPITPEDSLDGIQIRMFLNDDPSSNLPTETDIVVFDKLLKANLISRYEYAQLKNNDYYVRKATLNPAAKERQEIILKVMLDNKFITEQEYNEAKNEPIKINIGKNKQSDISSYFADKVKAETLEILKSMGNSDERAQDILYNGGLRIYSTMDPRIQGILETEVNNSRNYPRTRIDGEGIPQPQVAAVVMDYNSGFVRGLIGGRGISGTKIYNRALNPRQPGSSIKPIAVYLPALSHGFTAGSPVDDKPFTEGNYRPKNYSTYDGPTTVRNLVIKSSNVGAVRVAKAIGPTVMIDTLRKLGISTVITRDINSRHNDENLSLALGGMTKGTTPLDLTAAYATIANNGVYTKPIFVKQISTSSGNLLYEAKPETRKVATPQNSFIMKSILSDVVSRGTGARGKVSGQATAGKTGTTNDEKDVWFVGFTPYYSGAVWIGEDIPKDLNMTSDIPTALWGKIMNKVHSGLASKSFIMPSGIVGVNICDQNGEQSNEYCPRTRKEIYVSGTTPKEVCTLHKAPEPEVNPLLEPVPGEDIIDNTPPQPQNPDFKDKDKDKDMDKDKDNSSNNDESGSNLFPSNP